MKTDVHQASSPSAQGCPEPWSNATPMLALLTHSVPGKPSPQALYCHLVLAVLE